MASQLDALRTQARAAELVQSWCRPACACAYPYPEPLAPDQARAAELVQTAAWLERRKAEDDEANERYRLQVLELTLTLALTQP